MRAPEFWQERGAVAWALSPLGTLFGLVGSAKRRWAKPQHVAVPVICVGNLVAGGAGKTPVALALADLTRRLGWQPHILTRGYGGSLAGPVRVDPDIHDATMVGDEALLLAAKAPTWVARDRPAGARAAIASGATMILMDDGLQNPSLHRDWDIIVIDGGYGFGNGFVMPAGPLREATAAGIARARFAIIMGEDHHGIAKSLAGKLPVLSAGLFPVLDEHDWAGRRVLAFAGIGRPRKFFDTLRQAGADLVAEAAFPDHHPYRRDEIEELKARAARLDAVPVTTEKDWVRLPEDLRAGISKLPVVLRWDADGEAALISALEADFRPHDK